MTYSRQERLARQKKRLANIEAKINMGIAFAESELAYSYKVRSAYFLISMLTLWVKLPRNKTIMQAVEQYSRRMNYGYKKCKEEQKTSSIPDKPCTYDLRAL